MALDSTPAYARFHRGQSGQVYNEAAFRYFLAVDRKRAERLPRSILLVLVSVRQQPGRSRELSHAMAAVVFAGLSSSVREVDFVGWFQEGRVAGAVLAQGVGGADLRGVITKRILAMLKQSLPADRAESLRLRVVRLGRKIVL